MNKKINLKKIIVYIITNPNHCNNRKYFFYRKVKQQNHGAQGMVEVRANIVIKISQENETFLG